MPGGSSVRPIRPCASFGFSTFTPSTCLSVSGIVASSPTRTDRESIATSLYPVRVGSRFWTSRARSFSFGSMTSFLDVASTITTVTRTGSSVWHETNRNVASTKDIASPRLGREEHRGVAGRRGHLRPHGVGVVEFEFRRGGQAHHVRQRVRADRKHAGPGDALQYHVVVGRDGQHGELGER